MRRMLSLACLAGALFALPTPAIPLPGSAPYTAYGTEPFWDLRIAGGRTLVFLVRTGRGKTTLTRLVFRI